MGTPAAPPKTSDVVIIGAGVTGALVGDALTAAGLAVVVLDRRAPACGSTAASTSLLSYEIDVGLVELSEMIGEESAARAYRLSIRAVDDIAAIAQSLAEPCGYAQCRSICLATQHRHGRDLEEEAALRQRHGLDAEYWPAQRVARDVRQEGNDLVVVTDRGEVRARWVVYAMGYEMPAQLRAGMVALHTTYALVTEPLEDLGPWRGEGIVWETARPYIRPMADCPQALYALGYGANGITFGAVAARIVADICLGGSNDDARLFRLDRSP